MDEIGRGTSTRDGVCIAIAIAEALVESGAIVWFVTHFRDLAKILAERSGVVNIHLSVDMSSADKMKMLYRVAAGAVQEEHYGLALAKVVDLPPDVLRVAEHVSQKLTSNIEKRKRTSKTIALARRRKLILSLREQLVQAHEGNMNGKVLATWLQKLQDEFVNRMASIDADADSAVDDESEEESATGTKAEADGAGTAEIQKRDRSMSHEGADESGESMQWSPEQQRFEMTGAVQSEMGDEN